MAEQEKFWLINGRIFEHFRFEAFSWWELALIALVLSALGTYFLLAVLLERRHRARALRKKAEDRLEQWLAEWELGKGQVALLRGLAPERGAMSLYRLLSDPAQFERAVHEGFSRGLELDFTDRIRGFLEYRSSDPRVPVVSTRQLVVGDHLRFGFWVMAQPIHQYGRVISNKTEGLVVQCTEEGWAMVRERADEGEMFFLRDNDFEYAFPLVLGTRPVGEHQLFLEHQARAPRVRPRGTRLPVRRSVVFRAFLTLPSREEDGEGESNEPPRKVPGVLLEMSEGGFSAAMEKPVSEGGYLEFDLPLPRGREMTLLGRVQGCRPFGGTRWLARCEMRGFSQAQRGALSQLLRLAWRRRLHLPAPKARKGSKTQGGRTAR